MAPFAPLIIGIAGGTGSGKTTLARKLIESVPPSRAVVIEHDWYYRDRSHLSAAERATVNFDEPAALENDLLVEHLAQLKQGRAVTCPQYDFASHTRSAAHRRIEPSSIVVVEGILLFAVPGLREIFDLRIFVDTDDDIRLLRRLRRDIQDRGRDLDSIEAQYYGTVRPMHDLHVMPSRRHAHLIVPEGGENTPALEVIAGRLLQVIAHVDGEGTS
jgi:uridine kinase